MIELKDSGNRREFESGAARMVIHEIIQKHDELKTQKQETEAFDIFIKEVFRGL